MTSYGQSISDLYEDFIYIHFNEYNNTFYEYLFYYQNVIANTASK